MAISTTPVSSISGNATGTTVTVTLPSYSLNDYMVMAVSSNNGNAQTISSPVTATVLANAANRLIIYKLVPINGSQTSFTITVGANSVFTWWVATFSGVDASATVNGTGNNLGNSSTSAIEMPVQQANFVASGNELVLWAGGVNSTATWTTTGNTLYNTTANNAAMMVSGANMPSGTLTYVPDTMDRGNNGSARNESAAVVILQGVPNGKVNLLANPSFELGTTIATSWQDEHTTVGAATYSLTATGAVDGGLAQSMAYTGQGGDSNKVIEIFQSPISGMNPGDTLQFSVFVSGSITNTYCFIGIEGFASGQVYLSESDSNILTLTGTPVQYIVNYVCPPTTVAVAAYLQIPSIGPTVSFSITLDKAILTKVPASGSNNLLGVGI